MRAKINNIVYEISEGLQIEGGRALCECGASALLGEALRHARACAVPVAQAITWAGIEYTGPITADAENRALPGHPGLFARLLPPASAFSATPGVRVIRSDRRSEWHLICAGNSAGWREYADGRWTGVTRHATLSEGAALQAAGAALWAAEIA